MSHKQMLLVAGYVLLVALFIGLGRLSIHHLRAAAEADHWKTNSCHVLMQLRGLYADLTDAETGQRGFLITGNALYLTPYNAALRAIDQHRTALQTLLADNPRQLARLAAMTPVIDRRLADLARTIELRRTGGLAAALAEVLSNRGKDLMEEFRQQVAATETAEHDLLRQRTAAMNACRDKLILILMLGTFAGVTLIGVLILAVGREPSDTAIVNRSYVSRYGMAVALALLTMLALWLMRPIFLNRNLPLMTASIAIAGAAWWGGLGPGLLATGLTTGLTWWLFIAPRYALVLPDLPEEVRLLLNIFSGAVICALAESMHLAMGRQRVVTAELAAARAELEQTVEQRTAELRTVVEELEHFSYSLAHDMRAPLRAMQSFAALLLMKEKSLLDATERDYLRRIATAAVRMDGLVTDAFDFTRVMRAELPLSPVEPAAVIQDLLDTYPDFHALRADIRIEGALPRVLANAAGLLQVFSNLLHNAVKFVAPGVPPQVRITGAVRGDWVRLWVADNGIGIAPEFRPKLFQMFERFNGHYEGTGIGLALVRKVIERMGGTVGVDSSPGPGSRFWIELKGAP